MRVVRILRKILFPFSWLYGIGMVLRNFLYDAKILKSANVAVPVISVGNIVAGGTGKTPHVAYIVSVLLSQGKKVAIISRGYKRRTKGTFVVSDGEKNFGTVLECGDEPYFLAQKFPEAIILVDEKRVRAAQIAVEQYCVDVIILDDGFQHRALHRDLDIVLLDTTLDDEGLLPSGNRREHWRALQRSAIVILSRWSAFAQHSTMIQKVKKMTSAAVLKTTFVATCIKNFRTNEIKPIAELQNRNVYAFCGIGNPESFWNIIQRSGADIREFVEYPDHHYFSEYEIACMFSSYVGNNIDYVLTTEKDAVRLLHHQRNADIEQTPLWILPMETAFVEGEDFFIQELQKTIA